LAKKRRQGRPGWRLYINEIISIWKEKKQPLRFKEIHNEFVKRGIVSDQKYTASTTRILKSLIREGYIEKDEDGTYRLKISPKPFDAIKKATELRDKYGEDLIYEWRVGGTFWALAEGLVLGLPRNIEDNPTYRAVLNILLVRLAQIFEAIRQLAIKARLYNSLGRDIGSAPLPPLTLREYLLNIIPYVLGERSGIDHDGLSPFHIHTINKYIAEILPDEIPGGPIDKKELYRLIRTGERMMEQLRKSKLFDEESIELIESGKADDLGSVLLMIYPQEAYIDEKYDVRRLYETLTYLLNKGYSDASLLAQMKGYDEETIEETLNYLRNIVGKKKVMELKRTYRIMRAGTLFDEIIVDYLLFKEKYDKYKDLPEIVEEGNEIIFNDYAGKSREEILTSIKAELESLMKKQGYTLQEMIMGIWFGDWPANPLPKCISYFTYKYKPEINDVARIIQDLLHTLKIDTPSNLHDILKQGYELLTKLENMLEKDTTKNQ